MPTANFSLYHHMAQGGREFCGTFYKGTNLIHEGFILMTSSKTPSPNPITLEVRFQHINLRGTHSDYSSYTYYFFKLPLNFLFFPLKVKGVFCYLNPHPKPLSVTSLYFFFFLRLLFMRAKGKGIFRYRTISDKVN